MQGRFQPTESGFILEGEVRPIEVAGAYACSVTGAEFDADWHAATRSLWEALTQFEGRMVRITVEVVEPRPIHSLRELLERFREDAEELDDHPNVM